MNTPDFVRSVNEHMAGTSSSGASGTPVSANSGTPSHGAFTLTPNGMGFNFSSTPPSQVSNGNTANSAASGVHNDLGNAHSASQQNTPNNMIGGGGGAPSSIGGGSVSSQIASTYHPYTSQHGSMYHQDFSDYDTQQQQQHQQQHDMNGASYYAHHVMQHPQMVQQQHMNGSQNSTSASSGPSSTTQQSTNNSKSGPTRVQAPAFYTSSPSTHIKSHSAVASGGANSNSTSDASSSDDSNVIRLIEGLVDLPQAKYPGGKGNTRNPIPRQVVELDITKLPAAVNEQELLLQSEVLGFDKRVNGMVPIGILSPLQPFEKTSDGKYLSTYDNCILRFSSHSHGQKLALRWTLFSGGKRICSIDSSTFQTITERGIKKQSMRLAEKSGTGHSKIGFKNANKLEKKRKMTKWTLGEVKVLIEAIEQNGEQWAQILANTDGLDESRTEQMLQKKYKQLLE